ncbi:hypothetical protein PDQ75_24965 [Bacillus cereus group sp. Bc015]|uniref:hypothetical protein n=1 Tax=Bacillus cereus group sp. Bc015 TaxID=3018123 RepID=UPI0022E186F5|nr:hypothetical protein [Bacillus cereus group sp. Bc015]MDA2738408.1 hypothetical protein [Bacillus cereus group sp. Bc015]
MSSLAGEGQGRGRNKNRPTPDYNKVSGGEINNRINEFYTPEPKIQKKQVSIYLDTDVIQAFNKFGKDHGKGAKSDLVNNFLKQVFNIRQEDKTND